MDAKKLFMISLGMFFIVLLLGNISAQDEEINPDQIGALTKIFNNIKYNLDKIGLFTAEGQARKCSVNPDYIINPAQGNYDINDILNSANTEVALINVFDLGYNFLEEYRSEDLNTLTMASQGIIEVYNCPYEACSTDSECSDPFGNTCNVNYGSCYYSQSPPSERTPIYDCNTDLGIFEKTGEVKFGDERWCSGFYSNYKDVSGGEHCTTNADPKVTDGTWCYQTDDEESREVPHKTFNESEIIDSTSQELREGLCDSQSQCSTGSCKPIVRLIRQGSMTDIQADFLKSDFCSSQSFLDRWTILSPENVERSCQFGFEGQEQEQFNSLFGICVIEDVEGQFEAFEPLALFDVTGDGIKDGTDGLLITAGGVLFLVLLFSRLSGIYGTMTMDKRGVAPTVLVALISVAVAIVLLSSGPILGNLITGEINDLIAKIPPVLWWIIIGVILIRLIGKK